MVPWNIYCLKYGEQGEQIVNRLIEQGEVFTKEVDGVLYAGHREVSSCWSSGNKTSTDLMKAGSSVMSRCSLIMYVLLSSLIDTMIF